MLEIHFEDMLDVIDVKKQLAKENSTMHTKLAQLEKSGGICTDFAQSSTNKCDCQRPVQLLRLLHISCQEYHIFVSS